ncbi:ribonuclease H, partial [Trifolium pratense]
PNIPIDNLLQTEAAPLDCEIKETIFSMRPLKSPGPDGLHPIFFQSQWETVGASVCKVVKEAFMDPINIHAINETLLLLLPKLDGATSLKQFRPISLCNVIYKVITKVITNRLRLVMPTLIGQHQCSFIYGGQSADNIIIAQKVFHSKKTKTGKKGLMAIKVDLETAYDKLRWEFIIDTLKDIAIERLSHLINARVEAGRWKPVALSRHGPPISHLFFADDLILFGEASMDQMGEMSDCMNAFCKASGEKVSVEKTRLLVSKNVHPARAHELSSASGFHLTADFGKYLGVPILHSRQKVSTYEFLVEKVLKRLSSWKAKNLSFAGRVTLTRSVLAALPTYIMQTTLLPKGICNKIEQLMRNFIWGARDNQRNWHTIAWDDICRPKNQDGLGIKNVHLYNKSLIMKLAWNLLTNPSALWVQVLKSKYKCGDDLTPVVTSKAACSHIWRGVVSVWKDMLQGIQWSIANGTFTTKSAYDYMSHFVSNQSNSGTDVGWPIVQPAHCAIHTLKHSFTYFVIVLSFNQYGSSFISTTPRTTKTWMFKNQQVFDGKQFQTQHVINQVRALAADIQRIGHEAPHMGQQCHTVEVGWKPPVTGWIKCNSDGVLVTLKNKAACGGIIRDNSGGWITGLAWDKGFRMVTLESDSMTAMSLVVKGCPPTHPCYSIVALINCLKMRDWQVSINHIYRQANQVANWLAGYAINLPMGTHYLSNPPPGCINLLWQDIVGLHFRRSVTL